MIRHEQNWTTLALVLIPSVVMLLDTGCGRTAAPQSESKALAESKTLYDRAATFGSEGKFLEARDLLRRARTHTPRRRAIAASLLFAEDGAESRIPVDAGKQLFGSILAGNRGDWSVALSLADDAITLAPMYAPAYLHLGTIHAQLMTARGADQQHLQQAIKAYSKAIEIKRDYAEAHFNLGVAWAATKQWGQAGFQLESAKRIAAREKNVDLAEECDKILDSFPSRLFFFGPGGQICRAMVPSAGTLLEENAYRRMGGCPL